MTPSLLQCGVVRVELFPLSAGHRSELKKIKARHCWRVALLKLAASDFGTFNCFATFAAMDNNKAEALLARVNAALADHVKLIQQRRKRLKKSDSLATAEVVEREIDELITRVDVLKVQQKALKRGIIPDDLKDDQAA